jgi:HAD superfamily hydrolase (TIGR01509 family)
VQPRRPVDWVVFDVGETLVDETRQWGWWADELGVPRLTFFALLGAVIVAGRPYTDVFGYVRPDFDPAAARARRAAAGRPSTISSDDLYPDALPTLAALRAAGYGLAAMANQPLEVAEFLDQLPVDARGTSAQWGVAKPDARFFDRVAETVGAPPGRIAYVGDRVDNDVLPARRAGMLAVHVRRGPWGYLHADLPAAAAAHLRLDGLDGLLPGLAGLAT